METNDTVLTWQNPLIVHQQNTDILHVTELNALMATIHEVQQSLCRRYHKGSFLFCQQLPSSPLTTILSLDFPQGQYVYKPSTCCGTPMTSAERARVSVQEAASKNPFEYPGQGVNDVYYSKGRTALIVNTRRGRLIMSAFFMPNDQHSYLIHTAMLMATTAVLTHLRPLDEPPRLWVDQKLSDMKMVGASQGPEAIELANQLFKSATHPAIHAWRQARSQGELESVSCFLC